MLLQGRKYLDLGLLFLCIVLAVSMSLGLSFPFPGKLHQRSRSNFHSMQNGVSKDSKNFILDISMPGAHPQKPEQYLCTPSKRLPSRTVYIVEYEPHASESTAHHILLMGCKHPFSRKSIWSCGGFTCNGREQIIYAWAKNAKALKMPKDVGFAIGGKTGINYLVMQIHYARAMKPNERDHSGIKIHITSVRQKHPAAMFMLGGGETSIPPRSIGFHSDIACRYIRPYDIVPFAFRTHAHSTARVISGYRVRHGKWKLIGIGNPQRPQIFYPIKKKNQLRIHYGDIMAGRCTYDTPHRNRWTHMGATSKDEMCNFYMMYYKVYNKGSSHRKSSRYYPAECYDIQPGLPKLKYPANSDKLPASMKLKKGHHHYQHAMGDAGEEARRDDDDEDGEEIDPENPDRDGLESPDALGNVDDSDDFSRSGDEDPLTSRDLDDRLLGSAEDRGGDADGLSASESLENSLPSDKVHDQKSSKQASDHSEHSGNKVQEAMESDLNNLLNANHKETKSHDTKVNIAEVPVVDGDWPYKRKDLQNLGQVSALGMDSKHLIVFHRADRVWGESTFDRYNHLTEKYRSKIAKPTVLHLNPVSGAVVKKWGSNSFYLPHGLTVDKHGNIWVTDVGAHQVYKFSHTDLSKPALTLGIALTPGTDDDHFCKPADIAVESNGNFFVADGYCNHRIMKFTSKGELIRKWGKRNRVHGKPGPGEFNVPHSLALDEKNKLLYVADRENGRIQCFDTHGKFRKIIHHKEFGGRLFAVSFSPSNGLLYAISGPSLALNAPKPSGFTIDPKSKAIVNKWSPASRGFDRPHDVQSTRDNSAVYVCEIGPNRIWKFKIPGKAQPSKDKSTDSRKDRGERTTPAQKDPKSLPVEEDDEEEQPKETPYTLKKPLDEPSVVPAIVVVVVLATPIALICAAATIQHLRFKHQRNKALQKRNEEVLTPKSENGCFSCCRSKKYYYDNKRGFDKLIGEEDSEESEEDYFVRKGAI